VLGLRISPTPQPGHTITQSIRLAFNCYSFGDGFALLGIAEQKICFFEHFPIQAVRIDPRSRDFNSRPPGQPWYPISTLDLAIVGCDTCDRHTDYGFDAQKVQYFYNISHCHVCHTMAAKAGRRWVRLKGLASRFSTSRLFSCRHIWWPL
jgi:hypothetical protein